MSKIFPPLFILAIIIGVIADRQFSTPQVESSKIAKRAPLISSPQEVIYSGNVNEYVLTEANAADNVLIFDVEDQMGYLLVNGHIAASTKVAISRTASVGNTGFYQIGKRDRAGIPGTGEPYHMNLSGSNWVIHSGEINEYPEPNSISLPEDMAGVFFKYSETGTSVQIHTTWGG